MPAISVGVIGAGWMGRAHATAFENSTRVFGTTPATLEIKVVADEVERTAREFSERFAVKRPR